MWLNEVSVCTVYVNYLLPSLLAAYNAILRWQVQHMIGKFQCVLHNMNAIAATRNGTQAAKLCSNEIKFLIEGALVNADIPV